MKWLATQLDISRSAIAILRVETSSRKQVLVEQAGVGKKRLLTWRFASLHDAIKLIAALVHKIDLAVTFRPFLHVAAWLTALLVDLQRLKRVILAAAICNFERTDLIAQRSTTHK